MREPALEFVQMGAFVLAEAEEPTDIGADKRQQPLDAVLDRLAGSAARPRAGRWQHEAWSQRLTRDFAMASSANSDEVQAALESQAIVGCQTVLATEGSVFIIPRPPN